MSLFSEFFKQYALDGFENHEINVAMHNTKFHAAINKALIDKVDKMQKEIDTLKNQNTETKGKPMKQLTFHTPRGVFHLNFSDEDWDEERMTDLITHWVGGKIDFVSVQTKADGRILAIGADALRNSVITVD